jgi:nicotinamide-nucleotide adenylyltransferase
MITLFIGRFQPFHNGHLKDIKNCLQFSEKVVIGIGSSDQNNTTDNPFSYDERKEMIEKTLKAHNIAAFEIIAIPDVNDDSKWVEHVKKLVPMFDLAYTGNKWVKKLFESAGITVRDVALLKDINGTLIRKRINKSENWAELVPKEISDYIHKISGVNRIKKINGII